MKGKDQYDALCSEDDCFNPVEESDVERDSVGNIYPRSKKCWDCRTRADKRAIKTWRRKHRNLLTELNNK